MAKRKKKAQPTWRNGEWREGMPRKLAISYTRFSSDAQRGGTSIARQLQLADAWVEKNGYYFDDRFMFSDPAVSGTGDHKRKGALGVLLDMVARGDVPRGTPLVVEEIDRLTREPMLKAIKTVLADLIGGGVPIVTLGGNPTFYDEESIESGLIYKLIGEIQGANEYVAKLGRRVSAARERHREQAQDPNVKRLLSRLPDWLEYNAAAQKLIKEHALRQEESGGRRERRPVLYAHKHLRLVKGAKATINRLFDLWLDEGLGAHRIARALNDDPASWRPPGRKRTNKVTGKVEAVPAMWRTSYIGKLFRDRRLIGEFTPLLRNKKEDGTIDRPKATDPIPDYFPRVLSEEKWARAQSKAEALRAKREAREREAQDKNTKVPANGGRAGRSVFTHLAYCPYCAGPVWYRASGDYLYCANRKRVGCDTPFTSYRETESLVLDACIDLDPALVMGEQKQGEEQVARLREREDELHALVEENKRGIGNLMRHIEVQNDDPLEAWHRGIQARVAELQAQIKAYEAELATVAQQLAAVQRLPTELAAWQEGMERLSKSLAVTEPDPKVVGRLRVQVARFVERVELFSVGYALPLSTPQPKPRKAREIEVRRPGQRRGEGKKVVVEVGPAQTFADWAEDVAQLVGAPGSTREFVEFARNALKGKPGRFVRVWFRGAPRPVDLHRPEMLDDLLRLWQAKP